jgi:ketosteroid isomerase-like protein
MKRALVASLVCLPLATWVGAQETQQELTKVENGWAEAIVERDIGALQKLYADEYIATDPMGSVYTKGWRKNKSTFLARGRRCSSRPAGCDASGS